MLIETTSYEGAIAPSSFDQQQQSIEQDLVDFNRSVKINSYTIICNAIKSKGFTLDLVDTLFKGKMTRTMLVFTIGRSLDVPKATLLNIASSIEILHEASLVHDDIQDHQELRRGKQTVWKKYSLNEAISWGDFLLSLSLEPLLSNNSITDIKYFNETIQSMLEGQNLEQSSSSTPIGSSEYLEIAKLKTGSLIELPIKMLVPYEHYNYHDLIQASRYLGMAYQLENDLDDFSKGPNGIDFKNKISSLPFIKLYEIRKLTNKKYQYKNVFREQIEDHEFKLINDTIKIFVDLYYDKFCTIYKNTLSKECYNLLKKSFDLYFTGN